MIGKFTTSLPELFFIVYLTTFLGGRARVVGMNANSFLLSPGLAVLSRSKKLR